MTTTETNENEGVMRRIQALLERAAHERTSPEEREACEEKAEKLMTQHRIERAMLNFKRKDTPKEIVSRNVDRATGEYRSALRQMQLALIHHAGCQASVEWEHMTVVGYDDDIFYAEMIWAIVRMDFTTKMFPKWEEWRGFDANVYEIKSAGYSWSEVREMGLQRAAFDRTGPLTVDNAGSKLRTAFKREAKRRGVVVLPGKQQPMNPKLWRDSYVAAYRTTLEMRLQQLAAANRGPAEYALALQTDSDRVLAEFYRLFPNLHPDAIKKQQEEEERKRLAMYEAMSPEQKRQHDRNRKEWEKMMSKTRTADMRAWQKGAAAAEGVNLSRGNAVGDPDRKGLE